MKRAILKKFITILVIALWINSAISYVMISHALLDNTREGMNYTLEVLDNSLDYEGDIQVQIEGMQEYISNQATRFTVITVSGEVLGDNTIEDTENMVNHSDRKEFREALKNGSGYAKRYSETMGKYMFYVAALSDNGQYLLRVALPSTGVADYVAMLSPALVISFLAAILTAFVLAERFSRSITEPLRDIAEEMGKFHDPKGKMEFKSYEFEEINIISKTTKKMADEVNQYVEKLELERRVRQEFFSNASHELKTPITSVRGYTELIENGMVADEEKKKEYLGRIRKETENMTNLINDILMISRLETKELEVVMTDLSLSQVLNEVAEQLKPMAEMAQVEFTHASMPVMFHGNLKQMQELLSNLITNGIKYNKPGGRVHATIDKVRDEVIIQVYDTGVGIPEDSINRVFERFYRVDKGRSKKVGGTGLGLAIVKHIAGYYGGKIKVESKVDIGTTFTVYLPQRPAGRQPGRYT